MFFYKYHLSITKAPKFDMALDKKKEKTKPTDICRQKILGKN